jgi:hypothetical protein
MKRLLVLLLVLALVGTTSATILQFNSPGDIDNVELVYKSGSTQHFLTWYESPTGTYSYLKVNSVRGDYWVGFRLPYPYQTTYAAATAFTTDDTMYELIYVVLYDHSGNIQDTLRGGPQGNAGLGRYEVKVVGGKAYVYQDGTLRDTSVTLSENPSYIAFANTAGPGIDTLKYTGWKDFVYGQSEQKMMLDLPVTENNEVVILKDIINPAASGLAWGSNGTILNSNYMVGSWSRGNISTDAGPSDQPNFTIQLKNLGSGVVYATNYTGTAYSGTMTWDISTIIINAGAPQGYYVLYCPETLQFSNAIIYKSNGASVAWNADEYSVGDTGTVIYYVLAGGYWDTSLYSYKVCILDSYMNFIQNTTLTASSGTVSYDWTEDNPEGVYHAWLIAQNHDGYEYVLGSDYAELVAYFGYGGTVHDCITTLPIAGANVNITQGLTALYNGTSGYDGNYSSGPLFGTGSNVFYNVTMAGYNPYQYSFTPLSSGTVSDLNVTICPTAGNGDTGGLGIGGVIRDATIGRPIQGATVYLTNVSNSQQYTKTTNMAGGYICDLGTSCSLVSGRVYAVNASKVGYNTSVDYQVTV